MWYDFCVKLYVMAQSMGVYDTRHSIFIKKRTHVVTHSFQTRFYHKRLNVQHYDVKSELNGKSTHIVQYVIAPEHLQFD